MQLAPDISAVRRIAASALALPASTFRTPPAPLAAAAAASVVVSPTRSRSSSPELGETLGRPTAATAAAATLTSGARANNPAAGAAAPDMLAMLRQAGCSDAELRAAQLGDVEEGQTSEPRGGAYDGSSGGGYDGGGSSGVGVGSGPRGRAATAPRLRRAIAISSDDEVDGDMPPARAPRSARRAADT